MATIPSTTRENRPFAPDCRTTSCVAAGSVAVDIPASSRAMVTGTPISQSPPPTNPTDAATTTMDTITISRP